jgi:hypothetical protein
MGFFDLFSGAIQNDYTFNKGVAKRQEQDAQNDARLRRIQGERLMGEQVAAIGASGVQLSGSVVDQINQDKADAEIEALNIIYSGKMNAAQTRYQAKSARNRAYGSIAEQGAMAAGKAYLGGM